MLNQKMYPLKKHPGYYYSKLDRGAYSIFVDDGSSGDPGDMESAFTQIGPIFSSVRALKQDAASVIELEEKGSK